MSEKRCVRGRFVSKKEFSRRSKVAVTRTTSESVCLKNNADFIASGRRVIDLAVLAEELWCRSCNVPLSLKFVIEEKKSGLCSIFKVKCVTCDTIHIVSTSRGRPSKEAGGGPAVYDVNYKAAIGMIDAGIGPQQVNRFLTTLNVPRITENLLKSYERRVGPAIENVAKETCLAMAKIEMEMSVNNPIFPENISNTLNEQDATPECIVNHSITSTITTPIRFRSSTNSCSSPISLSTPTSSQVNQEESPSARPTVTTNDSCVAETPSSRPRKQKVPTAVKFDAGWQMRGNGKSYNSNSGHGAIMGHHTNKVLDFATRCKKCRRCERGVPQDRHDCRLNWHGSAKAMEPDIAVQLVTRSNILEEANLSVQVLVGDDDASTMAALRKENTELNIIKWSDLNHCKKGVTNALYRLKGKGFKALTGPVIKYLVRCFSYAVVQNKNNSVGLAGAITNIPHHAFGQHTDCGEWCNMKLDANAMHSSLPGGKPLSGDDLQKHITDLFSRFANNAEKIAPCASTQSNEALNSAISSKNPKAKFYSGSESNDFRVSAAVGQVNIGSTYVVEVNEKLKLSPGVHTSAYRTWLDNKRRKNKARASLIQTKKRRLLLKSRRNLNETRKEHKEGLCYESAMDMMVPVPVVDDVLEICMPMQIDGSDVSKFKLAYYDIETTGLANSSHVIQIAAYVDDDLYSAYVMPPYIPKRVSEVTGLTIQCGSLNLNNKPVVTVTKKEAWVGLIRFLSKFDVPFILVGHNVSFDLRFTLKEISECNLATDFLNIVYGSTDTLKLVKKVLPNLVNYKQGTIADHLSAWDMSGAGAHNAIGDVRTLKNIIDKLAITDVMVKEDCQSITSQMDKKRKVAECKRNTEALQPLKDCAGISETMVRRIASAGISLRDIEEAVNQNGEDGVRILFTQNCNNRPKVTNNKKVIKNVLSYFKR